MTQREPERGGDGLATSVTWLFVPGDRPERFDKAVASGADEVILDLEDAVPSANKSNARASVASWLSDDRAAWVRINGVDSEWFCADTAMLLGRGRSGLKGIIVPKANSEVIEHLHTVAERNRLPPLVALIETAAGVRDADAMAAHPAVVGLAFGAIDFALDVEAADESETVAYARVKLVVAARAAGLPGPIDGVCVEVESPQLAGAEARHARALGMGGKLCIHPSQLSAVAAAYRPDAADLAWATALRDELYRLGIDIRTADPAMAIAVNGRMVDRPVLLRARRMLAADGTSPQI